LEALVSIENACIRKSVASVVVADLPGAPPKGLKDTVDALLDLSLGLRVISLRRHGYDPHTCTRYRAPNDMNPSLLAFDTLR
jgi:hypothetical protein